MVARVVGAGRYTPAHVRVIEHPRAPDLEEAPVAGDVYRLRRREAVAIWAALTAVRRRRLRVLDLGCGDGFRAAILARAGCEVTARSSDEARVRRAEETYARSGLAFEHGQLPVTGHPEGAFEAVVCCGVLERLPDPSPLLGEAQRLLGPGGILLLATSNRLTSSPGRTRPIAPGHAWEYTRAELHKLIRDRFRGVELRGLVAGRRLRALERVTGEPLHLLLRRLPTADRSWWLRASLGWLRPNHFEVRTTGLDEAIDLLAAAEA